MLHRARQEDLGHPELVLEGLPLHDLGPFGRALQLVEARAGAPDLEAEGEPDRKRLVQRPGPAPRGPPARASSARAPARERQRGGRKESGIENDWSSTWAQRGSASRSRT